MNKVAIWLLSVAMTAATGTNFDALSHLNMMNKALQSHTPLREDDVNQYYEEIQRGVNGTTATPKLGTTPNTLRAWIALDSTSTETSSHPTTNGTRSTARPADVSEMDARNRRALRIADHSDSKLACNINAGVFIAHTSSKVWCLLSKPIVGPYNDVA